MFLSLNPIKSQHFQAEFKNLLRRLKLKAMKNLKSRRFLTLASTVDDSNILYTGRATTSAKGLGSLPENLRMPLK